MDFFTGEIVLQHNSVAAIFSRGDNLYKFLILTFLTSVAVRFSGVALLLLLI